MTSRLAPTTSAKIPTVQVQSTGLFEYFNGEKQNLVPLFQRAYEWKPEQWRKFWDDLVELCEEDKPHPHFMGTVVTVSVHSVPVGVPKNLVIDGQQRLTTLSLLLAAVRDLSEGKLRGRIDDLLVNQHAEDPDRLKLVPTETDRTAYRAVIDGAPVEHRSRITRAYRFFRRQIEEAAAGDGPTPDRLHENVRQSLQVVGISLTESDDPYVIFESLNHDGLPLTEADLVRNTVLMRFPHSADAGQKQARVHQELWLPIEQAVGETDTGRSNLSEFLRHYAMTDGADVRKSGIYSAVKLRLDGLDRNGGEAAVRDELVRLLRLARHYRRFLNPEDEPDPQRRKSLTAIREAKSTVSYPLLLALHDAADDGRLPPAVLTECLRWIESFVIRRLVCDLKTNALRRLFIGWCKALSGGGDIRSTLRERMHAGERGSRWPDDGEFRLAFRTLAQYGRPSDRAVLERLEVESGHKEPASLDSCQIEHVLPQTLSSEWRTLLGESAEEIHATHLHRFGNLTLTGYNPELGNRPFAEKRPALAKSHVELNRWIAEQQTWGPDEIDTRGAALADRAVTIWPRPPQLDADADPGVELFHVTGPHAAGMGHPVDGGFLVSAGSTCRRDAVESARTTVDNLRAPLLSDGTLVPEGTTSLRFTRDYKFESPSGASVVVLGRTSNGWKDWRAASGRSLADSVNLTPESLTEE